MSPCRAGEQIVSDGISAPASGGGARLLGGSNEQNRTSGMGSRLYDPRRTSSKGNGLYDDRSDGHIDPVRGRRSFAVSGVTGDRAPCVVLRGRTLEFAPCATTQAPFPSSIRRPGAHLPQLRCAVQAHGYHADAAGSRAEANQGLDGGARGRLVGTAAEALAPRITSLARRTPSDEQNARLRVGVDK